jgi:hypothetical protein
MPTYSGDQRAAASEGACVIVGREAQYFLQGRADTYHVFLYRLMRRKFVASRTPAEASWRRINL